ncbi:MAG: polyprenyl synthetase family protein [Syntrophomonadaceae bacterium]|nr:polyprenyl synthetase family protein [Syntrophomonadaceae bacterium]
MAYLANYIHESVKDDEEGQIYNQKLQFTILIGDYLFGKMMSLLLEAGGGKLVSTFADMLAENNEGLIIKYKIDQYSDQVVRRTKAAYYSYTFLTAAQLAGIDCEEDLDNINDLGTNLGIIMYLLYNKGSHEQIRKHILLAHQLFDMVNRDMKVVNSYLEKSLKEISEFFGSSSEVAVI